MNFYYMHFHAAKDTDVMSKKKKKGPVCMKKGKNPKIVRKI